MKYKICSIVINVTKYDVTFASEEMVLIPTPLSMLPNCVFPGFVPGHQMDDLYIIILYIILY